MHRDVLILDGGASRELQRLGAPFRQPEWSALSLIEAPEYVTALYRAFADAGADVITTNAYAVVPFHIGQDRFDDIGHRLATDAARRARQVGDEYGILVAGDLPPALGSYRPDLFEPDRAADILSVLIDAQSPFVDLWLSETLSSIVEAELVSEVLEQRPTRRPWWVSFTLDDELDGSGRAVLRSGEPVGAAVERVVELGAARVAFNCSPPEVMEPAVREAREVSPTVPLGVYANAFDLSGEHDEGGGANTQIHGLREDLAADAYRDFAGRWVAAGATAVGGCCGVGSAHITALAEHFGNRRAKRSTRPTQSDDRVDITKPD